jgi:quercetin dioxygenase-like cupin family protein
MRHLFALRHLFAGSVVALRTGMAGGHADPPLVSSPVKLSKRRSQHARVRSGFQWPIEAARALSTHSPCVLKGIMPVFRLRIPLFLAMLLVGLMPASVGLAQQAPAPVPPAGPSGPLTRFPTRFTIADAPDQFEQVLMVIDFEPGSWTPPHMPGGNVYNTVVAGAISTRPMGGTSATTYDAGARFVAPAGEYVEVGNGGDVSARMISTTVLPKHTTLFTYADTTGVPPPRPTVVGQSAIDIERPSRVFELQQMLVEFEPGMWTATHMHGGYDLSMVATGAIRLERRGEDRSFSLGESFVNTPGLVHRVGNESESFTQMAVTFLVPTGATLTTVQPADTPVLTAAELAD